ncbi:HepT-like ribonuclease domain-containing protein [Rhizobium sp.]
MDERLRYRLLDILDAIDQLEMLFGRLNYAAFIDDRVRRAACERFLETLSEASRHIPDAWKAERTEIPWRQIADMGNHLRHAYHAVDPAILWQIHENGDLDALKAAVEHLLKDET